MVFWFLVFENILPDKSKKESEVMGHVIMNHMERKFMDVNSERIENEGILRAMIGMIQTTFHSVVERFESPIQDLTGRPLKEACSLYKTEEQQFYSTIAEYVTKFFDTSEFVQEKNGNYMSLLLSKVVQISFAAQGIANGNDVMNYTCWECSVSVGEEILTCAHCRTAKYCSRECQVKSWKGDHKEACDELKGVHERFLAELDAVDQQAAHGSPTKNIYRDYNLFSRFWTDNSYESMTKRFNERNCPGPSTEIFYRNISSLAQCKKHWLFSSLGNETATKPMDPSGEPSINLVCFSLAYDTSKRNLIDSDMVELCSLCCEFVREDFQGPLTAERFLHLYATTDEAMRPLSKDHSSKYARSKCRTEVLKMLNEKYNKKE